MAQFFLTGFSCTRAPFPLSTSYESKKHNYRGSLIGLELLLMIVNRFSNASWSWKFVVDCSSFSSDQLLLSTAKGEAGKYTAVYQKLAQKHHSFRDNIDLIVTMSFVFSGILTPIPAFGFLFDNEEVKGPVIQYLIRPEECLKRFHPIDLEKLQFVGAPWTLHQICSDTPIVFYTKWKHGSSSADVIGLDWTVDMADGKRRLGSSVRDLRVHGNVDPSNLLSLIPALTEEIYRWIVYFVELKSREDCWTNLHGIYSNLGHGVLVGTSEEALAHFFETARSLAYETLFLFHVLPRDFSSMYRLYYPLDYISEVILPNVLFTINFTK
ncbi:BnaC07g31200D [Brassica napus]|uniref:BnaC07g31200D protein n=1 Tax=Brassica napus TaxID=3708 RepID=A0A078GDH3_BRANA|nr:BnaC07g31200D [Brassica napus]